MAKRYYWLKLKADWFSDKRIKKLRSIAGGDIHTIIYLKMMLLSLKDEGKLYFEGVEDNFASEIALALDEDAENVKLTLAFLQRHGLIEIGDDDDTSLRKCQQSSARKRRQPYVQGNVGNGKNSLRLDRKRCNATQMKRAATI
jgi:predicted phage replisome organizer